MALRTPATRTLVRVDLPPEVDAVVFDCDGLLLDTEGAWRRAEAAVFADRGVPFGRALQARLLGGTLEGVVSTMTTALGTAGQEPVLAAELLQRVAAERASAARVLPGVRELLLRLSGVVPLGVATNSGRADFDRNIAGAGLAHWFTTTRTADDVRHGKPDPAVYLAVFDALGARPERVVVFEDSATGATAARAAGAFVVAVPQLSGTPIPAHTTVRSLADPSIRSWARAVRAARPVTATS